VQLEAEVGPVPRPCFGGLAVRWLRWRGLLVLYRGQPALEPFADFLSPIARGEQPFFGQTGLAASELAAADTPQGIRRRLLQAVGPGECRHVAQCVFLRQSKGGVVREVLCRDDLLPPGN
jgi:hypothetical protein